jgi:hypothetical protein
MNTRRLVALVIFVFVLAGAYMVQRDLSLRFVRRQARQEAELRALVEQRDRLLAELEHLAGFARLDSVWVSCGRPNGAPAMAASGVVGAGPVSTVEVADSRRGTH